MTIEIVMPVRNPGEKLLESIESLTAQADRDFGVLISDNFSTSGVEWIDSAVKQLTAAGIAARVVRPPCEFGRVEHWNWAHSASEADWLKPLFVGDLLAPRYIEALRDRVATRPGARVVRCEFDLRTRAGTQPAGRAPCAVDSLTPAQFLDHYPHRGNWIGGPVNIVYHRLAWQLGGGYLPQFPACADLQLYVAMILRHGIELIREPLATFQLHTERFSHGIGRRSVNGCFELWLILRHARNYCLNAGLPWPHDAIRRALALQVRLDYLHPIKQRVKDYFGA
jgi:hypothetical protein